MATNAALALRPAEPVGAEAASEPWDDPAKFTRDDGDAYFAAVKARVAAYLESSGKSRFDDGTILLKGLLFGSLAALFYALVLANSHQAWVLQLFAIGFGVSALLLALNVGHDAAHNSLSPHRRLNTVVQTVVFTVLGANAYLWRLRHVKSHHVFPNVNGCDIDVDTTYFLRLSPNQRRRWYHRWQHLYAPLIFWLVDVHSVFWQDFEYLFKRRLANMRDIRHPIGQYALFAACKLAYVAIVFAIPFAALDRPWWHIVAGALVMSFVASALFVTLLIGTHFAEETVFPNVGPDGRVPHSWVTHALITSLDWSPESRVANFIAGGVNAHAAHHLFPTVAHIHYVAITRIIREEAARHGMPYNAVSLRGMILSHIRFLKRLGRGDQASAAISTTTLPMTAPPSTASCAAAISARGSRRATECVNAPCSIIAVSSAMPARSGSGSS